MATYYKILNEDAGGLLLETGDFALLENYFYDTKTLTVADTASVSGTNTGDNVAASTSVVGPANLKSYNTNLKANIKSINTNLLANVKKLDTNV
jgi:hypothetical protein